MNATAARELWQLIEPVHAVVYFASEKREVYNAAGLKGGWMGYFASRSAAMGPVGAEVVTATFYNFHPAMVARAIPDAWEFSTPERVLEARLEIVDRALRRLLGKEVDAPDVAEAARLILDAALACEPAGRPLFAAHASLEASSVPHLALWQAATLVREHRGDGHVISLAIESIGGCEANVLMAAAGLVSESDQRSFRGWSDDDWLSARDRLQGRGLVDGDGRLTAGGRNTRDRVEESTDRLARPVVQELGEDGLERVRPTLERLRNTLLDAGSLPYPNPIGLPPPGRGSHGRPPHRIR